MSLKQELINEVDDLFKGNYVIHTRTKIPDIEDIHLDKHGEELELAMLFIDIRDSTGIINNLGRLITAKIYKSFILGVAKIAKENRGELRGFNGDGILIAFSKESKSSDALSAAFQMSWFMKHILKPKVEEYFQTHPKLKHSLFNFGIGIDIDKVLVIRAGISGKYSNDLVWVSKATSNAAKLASLSAKPESNLFNIFITGDIFSKIRETVTSSMSFWEEGLWNNIPIYQSNHSVELA